MAYADKTLTCVECKSTFVFTAREQEFHASKGFANEPKRCASCRMARKAQRGDSAPAGVGAGPRPQPQAAYSGPRAQGASSGGPPRRDGGRPRTRRNDGDRGGRETVDTAARSFAAADPSRSYTANCTACGNETPVAADSANKMVLCSDCYSKMTALVRS